MTSILVVLSQSCAVTSVATDSRQLFSFAPDHGALLVHSQQVQLLMHVGNPSQLSLCHHGLVHSSYQYVLCSSIGFNWLISHGTVALLSSYLMSITSMAFLRLNERPLLRGHFPPADMGWLLTSWPFCS